MKRRARRDSSGRLVSEAELHRQSASSLERLYNDGRASKRDVTAWVRMSAKLSGRIYQPRYSSGAYHDRLSLHRREDAEDKLFAKKKGYFAGPRASRSPTKKLRREQTAGSFIVVLSTGQEGRFHDMLRARAWAHSRLQGRPGMWAAFYRALVAKGRSDTGAPWTEPFHFEETNERGNIAIVRIPRTGMTRSAAKHDPQKSRSRRDVVREPKRNPHVEREMLLGFLEAVWLDSYMSWAEESGHGHRTGHIPQHVRGLSDIPQAPPLAAKKLAKKYASILVKMNRASLTQIWERASHADGKGADPRQLGFNLAMQSRGHGISWTDDHAPFKLALPSAEWSAYGSKGRVRVDGYVSERRPSKLH